MLPKWTSRNLTSGRKFAIVLLVEKNLGKSGKPIQKDGKSNEVVSEQRNQNQNSCVVGRVVSFGYLILGSEVFMVFQIRGTSGSGKTWVMRRVMGYLDLKPQRVDSWRDKKRRQPLYYYDERRDTAVCGHYESACGGCDNVGSAAAVYELYQKIPQAVILSEGLLLSEDVKWTSRLASEGIPVRIVFLATDVERCVEQIKNRRRAAGNTKPLNEANTRNRVAVIERAHAKLLEVKNVTCRRASARQAYKILKGWLDAERN